MGRAAVSGGDRNGWGHLGAVGAFQGALVHGNRIESNGVMKTEGRSTMIPLKHYVYSLCENTYLDLMLW